MKILVVGGGGREHALVWKIAQNPRVQKIFCAPGNAGIAELATCLPLKGEDTRALLDFALKEKMDLTVVGPESPLTLGLVDAFEKKGLKVFGVSKKAALLEASKDFAKRLMIKYHIPYRGLSFLHRSETGHGLPGQDRGAGRGQSGWIGRRQRGHGLPDPG